MIFLEDLNVITKSNYYWVVKSADSFKTCRRDRRYRGYVQTLYTSVLQLFRALFGPGATAGIEIAGKSDNTSVKHSCYDCPSHALREINSRGLLSNTVNTK